MKTVDKALKVLDQFSLEVTEVGLSELSRMAELDKAATRRLLVALGKHGFIEQSAETRKYRLGPGFLRLAHIREATVPMAQAAREVCEWLVDEVGETVHVSVPWDRSMATIAHRLPRRGNVINIDDTQALYFHATSSGLAYLAFTSEEKRNRLLALKREAVANSTVTDKTELLALLATVREQGYSANTDSFEDGVASMGVPFYLEPGEPAGTVAIALPSSRFNKKREAEMLPALREAVERIEHSLKGFSS